MIKHIWSIVCSKSSIDKETNNVSLFEVLEQLSFTVSGSEAKKAKAAALDTHAVAPLNFELVTLLEREDTKGALGAEIQAGIVDPTGKTLGNNLHHSFSFAEGQRRMRITLKIMGMPVTRSGIYQVQVMLKEGNAKGYDPVAKIPLEVAINFN